MPPKGTIRVRTLKDVQAKLKEALKKMQTSVLDDFSAVAGAPLARGGVRPCCGQFSGVSRSAFANFAVTLLGHAIRSH